MNLTWVCKCIYVHICTYMYITRVCKLLFHVSKHRVKNHSSLWGLPFSKLFRFFFGANCFPFLLPSFASQSSQRIYTQARKTTPGPLKKPETTIGKKLGEILAFGDSRMSPATAKEEGCGFRSLRTSRKKACSVCCKLCYIHAAELDSVNQLLAAFLGWKWPT
jgi:hypothetical protein